MAIWKVSLLLALVSLGIMLLLILRRLVASRKNDEQFAERQRLLGALIAFSNDHDHQKAKLALEAVTPKVALDASFEFLGLLRGEEHQELVSVLRESRLGAHVVRELRNRNEAKRIYAAEMLAVIRPEDATAALARSLHRDRSHEVRIAAAIALADMGQLPPLADVVRQIGPQGQRSRRIVELFRHLPADRLSELSAYLRQADTPALVRAAAIESLAQTSDADLISLIDDSARDASPEVAAAAIRAIGRISMPNAEPAMVQALQRNDWQIRREAAEAIGRLGLVGFVQPLADMLEDESWIARYSAAKALRQVGREGEERLRLLSAGSPSRSQRTASMVLGEGQRRV